MKVAIQNLSNTELDQLIADVEREGDSEHATQLRRFQALTADQKREVVAWRPGMAQPAWMAAGQ